MCLCQFSRCFCWWFQVSYIWFHHPVSGIIFQSVVSIFSFPSFMIASFYFFLWFCFLFSLGQSINTDDFSSLQITWSNFNRVSHPLLSPSLISHFLPLLFFVEYKFWQVHFESDSGHVLFSVMEHAQILKLLRSALKVKRIVSPLNVVLFITTDK